MVLEKVFLQMEVWTSPVWTDTIGRDLGPITFTMGRMIASKSRKPSDKLAGT